MTLIVVKPGVLTLIEDAGRSGFARFGVARSGAFDLEAWAVSNELVGNSTPTDEDDCGPAALEVLLGGLEILTTQRITFAVVGAQTIVTVIDAEGRSNELPMRSAHTIESGSTLNLGRAKKGLRSYVSFSGGIEAPLVLGSRSYDTTAQLGPLPLSAGTQFEVKPAPPREPVVIQHRPAPGTQAADSYLRVSVGPDGSRERLANILDLPWRVSPDSNRTGVRLTPSEHAPSQDTLGATSSMPSAPSMPGTVQALPNGELVVFGPDGPTTGGYSVIAVMDRMSLGALGQRRPGESVFLRE